jgi:type IV pilus assembly protein PilP
MVSFVVAGLLGVLLLSPWWRHSWQIWEEALEAQTQLRTQQEATQALRAQTAQWGPPHNQSPLSLGDAAVLAQLAQAQGLQLTELGLDKPQHSPALDALHLQALPVHVQVQGAWEGWLNWLAQWPMAAPGVTVSSLALTADPSGGIAAHVLAVVPQLTATDATFELATAHSAGAALADPFSATGWAHAQRAHAQQHPSYVRWVAPELSRPRDALEAFPRERLQYVGQIASKGDVEALVKVLPSAGTQKDSPLAGVHRVRVGSHLGQNFGKVLAVQPDQLVVQELALMPTGEWQTRELRLPLHEAAP